MLRSLFPWMVVALSVLVAPAARADLLGIVVDGTMFSYSKIPGTKYVNTDSVLGYHLSGTFEFDGSRLYYSLLLNGGPSLTANISMFYTGPASWYSAVRYWGNSANVRYIGSQAGQVYGQAKVGNAINAGNNLGSAWTFVNVPGGQDSFDQYLGFTNYPQNTTFSINLTIDKTIGLSVETRGSSGVSDTPEPGTMAMMLSAGLGLGWWRRHAKN